MAEFPAFPAVLEPDVSGVDDISLWSKLRRSPRTRARQLVDLAGHVPELIALAVRIHRAGFGHAARSEPVVLFKYLGHYLANSFGTAARLRIMSHHYETLAARFPGLARSGLPRNGMLLWSRRVEPDIFTIRLCMPAGSYLEGDLALVFSVNAVRLHKLSFTCVPGDEVGVEARTALLIGGSTGYPGTSALIRQASKTIGEISPATMLVLALQALAKRLGAEAILGVSADEQTSLRDHPEQAKSCYDALWEMTGGERQGSFYRLPDGVAWKDTSHLSNGHRPRTRRKRELKERILAQIRANADRFVLAAFSISVENLVVALRTVELGI